MAAGRLEEICRRHGLAVRGRRRVVLAVLDEARDEPTMEEIYRRAVFRDRRLGYATTRRMLGDLVSAGLIARLQAADNELRYRKTSDGQTRHLIDMDTGAVLEFSSLELDRAIEAILAEFGYELKSYRLRLTGRKKPNAEASAAPGHMSR